VNDPGQWHNLWHQPGVERIKDQLSGQLLAELIRTDSRLPRQLANA
jgi:hypothetical protein